jgi:serine protease
MQRLRLLLGMVLITFLTACGLSSDPELDVLVAVQGVSLDSTDVPYYFSIRNAGEPNSLLQWSISSSAAWLSPYPATGSLAAGEYQTLTIAVNQGSLNIGQVVTGTLTITSNGGSKNISVVFTKTSNTNIGGLDQCGTHTQGTSSLPGSVPLEATRVGDGLKYVPGQLLIGYHETIGTLSTHPESYLSTTAAVQSAYNLQPVKAGGGFGPDLVHVAAHEDVELLAQQLEQDPRVAYAEPNYYLHLLAEPNDPYYAQQWNMSLFGLPQAWDIQTGSSSITVAVIDAGIDMQHEDLAGRLLPGCDFYDHDNDPSPGPNIQHGTHVAGIVAASGNNGKGVAGVAYTGVRILPVKVFSNNGVGATASMVADAIRWSAGLSVSGVGANTNPARIINLSLGMNGTSQALNTTVASARDAGAIVVAASGNDGISSGIMTPANAPGIVAVGSVDATYERSSFSSYNTNGRTVDLMAPGGSSLRSCTYVPSTFNDNGYGCMAGTSMASPFVAGVAALVWSQNPALSADQVTQKLLEATYRHPSWDPQEYGTGVICADKALGANTRCGE